ncbi:MAG: amino acid ABC transporter permease [Rhodobacteraceae bacterium]|jgi:polar amino acid transport system permease protein|nr:amino acid ABC transporter permease [Paracoccaceae bacterium]MBT4777103.1 amino acid ABC transporter permease [Paracoccaceae bacterium]MBT6271887.1 amino acid ABC transporter permease [Paracoccaceae bacterium]MBT6437026.1 amino acid ABC transporter permease [Paracoccaceae bacterium]|tara:strand:+ start:303 stop:1145 length:843 start_codon:yes stop_codon:yes gene_type:complete
MEASGSMSMKGLPVRRPPAINRFFSSTPVSIVIYLLIIVSILYSSFRGAQSMGYNWQWYQIPKYIYSYTDDGFQFGELMFGLWTTITLSFSALILAMLFGLLVALLRLSNLVIGTKVAICFLEFVRNIPLLVLVYLFYYVLGPVFEYDRYTASVLCLAVYHSALISEILRAGINAVAQGQWEAAKSIGMSKPQMYRYIILPQSIRFMLPPMTGEVVHMVKSSAIVSVIAVAELTTLGQNIISDTYMAFEIWFTIAVIYMIVIMILSIGASQVERRYTVTN